MDHILNWVYFYIQWRFKIDLTTNSKTELKATTKLILPALSGRYILSLLAYFKINWRSPKRLSINGRGNWRRQQPKNRGIQQGRTISKSLERWGTGQSELIWTSLEIEALNKALVDLKLELYDEWFGNKKHAVNPKVGWKAGTLSTLFSATWDIDGILWLRRSIPDEAVMVGYPTKAECVVLDQADLANKSSISFYKANKMICIIMTLGQGSDHGLVVI